MTKGNKKYKMKNNSSISLSCCIMALLLQIFELKHLVDIENLSAVLDTVNARSVAAIVLVVATMMLNILASKRGH